MKSTRSSVFGMDYTNTISGLQRKRNELARTIENSARAIQEMHSDIAALDAALRVFGVSSVAPPRKHERRFVRGEVQRLITSELRVRPMTQKALVARAIALKGKEQDSIKVQARVNHAVRNALVKLRDAGRIEQTGDEWQMVRSAR